MATLVGQTVSHYKILEHLGGGGMGVVYKAQDLRLDRPVALKFLPADLTRDPEAKQRFIHEAKAASALDHQNICVVHDIGETDDGQIFIVMAYYEGETLKKKIERGPLRIEAAIDTAIQVAHGLAKAHEHGIVHRDVKPANIMMTGDGVAKIVDFGLAKLSGRTMLTRTGATLGTAAYMSPEQARGEPSDGRTDIWSLGVVLYEMLTGRRPFDAEYENALLYSILNAEPEPVTGLRTGLPVELERILRKTLAKRPSDRYQHLDELLVDLRYILKEEERTAPPRSTAPLEGQRHQPPWRRVAIGAAVLLVLTVAVLFLKPALFDEVLVSEPKPVAVITFTNQTGDRSYDYLQEAIPNLLTTSLEQSRYLRVMTWERMRDVLMQMGRKDVAVIDRDLGFEICRREGIYVIVLGSFVKAGETFATDVKVLDVATKEILKTASARGKGVQSILDNQIDELSREIARGVGLSQAKIESSPAQIAEVTTTSMDAYNYFLRGRDDIDKFYYEDARRFLERAVALDSSFAIAYHYLSEACGRLLEFNASLAALQKAMALSSKAPEKERLLIQARYASYVDRNQARRGEILEELARRYPMEKRVHMDLGTYYRSRSQYRQAQEEVEKALQLDPNYAAAVNLLAYTFADQGRFDKAVENYQRYASLSPGDANPFDSMAELYLRMGRLDESIARYREAIRVEPSFTNAYRSLAYVYALKEDYRQSLCYVDSLYAAAPSAMLKAEALAWQSMYLRKTGKLNKALQALDKVGDLVAKAELAFAAPLHWLKAWYFLEKGDLGLSRRHFVSFSESFSNPNTPIRNSVVWNICMGFLALKGGKVDSVQSNVTTLRQRMGSIEDSSPAYPLLAGTLEAELLLAKGLADSAIRVCRATPVPAPSMGVGWRMPMYNVPRLRDIVPRAFQRKGEFDSAIVSYERLLKIDPSNDDRRLLDPIYHYRLAKLYDQTGKKTRAAAEYRRFLEQWKEADRDLPELTDARKSLAKCAAE